MPILDRLHDQLIEHDPEYVLLQVKEKLGGLRVYADFAADVAAECRELVRHAERRAAKTCEKCGEPGSLRTTRTWVLTLCDACDALEPGGRPDPSEWDSRP